MSFKAPFFIKTKFYSPTVKNQSKNAAHISYIAQRPGVEVNDQLDLRDADDKNITRLVRELDYEVDPDSPEGHAKYIDERPRSHGLFGRHGSEDIKAIQNELKDHKGIVWRSILSLTEEDARRLNFMDQDSWKNMLKATVPDVAAKMGIKDSNLRWTAAYHHEKGHPHVHLMMWEKEPKRTKGLMSSGERRDVRKVFVKEVFAEERLQLTQEKTAMRDLLRDMTTDDVKGKSEIVKEIKHFKEIMELEKKSRADIFTKVIYPMDQENGISSLRDLGNKLPGRGRIAMKYMPDDVKESALNITKDILNSPQFTPIRNRYLKAAEDLAKPYSFNEENIKLARQNALEDLEKRLSQIVLRGAAETRNINRYIPGDSMPMAYNQIMNSVWKGVQQGLQQGIAEQEYRRKNMEQQLIKQAELERFKQQESDRERG